MPSPPSAVEAARRPCLLLVDDTPENLGILVGLLESDYELKTASCGEEALKICDNGGRIDLILLDVTMPGMDGFEVCQLLRGRPVTRETPILFLTGRSEVDDVVQGFEAGGNDYLTKPFRMQELLARVRTHLTLRAQQLEIAQKKAALEDDLNMAREVQIAFLPQQFPSFPRGVSTEESALGFCSRYLPATTLGGDFFHVMPISDACAGVLICDVMGHGVQAALVTAIHRALVEELSEFASDPGAFFTEMNRALLSILRRTRSPMFASAFYLTIDVESGLLRYANAGHPSPFLLRRSTGIVSRLEERNGRRGPALGVFEGRRYGGQERRIEEGDMVILFTDGLYEAENASGETFDQPRLLEAVQARRHLPPNEILDGTIAEVRRFSAANTFIDDVCLVGVEALRVTSRVPESAPLEAAAAAFAVANGRAGLP